MTRRPAAFLIAALLVTPALALAPLGTAQAKDAEVATVVAEEGVFGSAVSFDARLVPIDVDLDRRCAGAGRRGLLAVRLGPVAAERHLDARHQFADGEGLGEVVVGAEVEPGDLVSLGVPRGDDDDGDLRLAPDDAEHVEAGEAGEHQVEDHQIRTGAAELFEPRDPVGYGFNAMARPSELIDHHVADCGVVFDDEDFCHALIPPAIRRFVLSVSSERGGG